MSSDPQHARGRHAARAGQDATARNEPRGRHAKPPTKAAVTGERILTTALSERHRGKLLGAGGAALSAAALAVVVMVGLPGGGSEPAEAAAAKAAAVKARAGGRSAKPVNPSPAVETVTAMDTDEDLRAIAFMKQQDPQEKVLKHVKEVRQTGDFLRVYTDPPEEDENSDQAVSLCEWATEYVKSTQADATPLVFIHAKESDNGAVVLANKDSAKDSCTVDATR